MTSVSLAPSMKSPLTAGGTGLAETVTVKASEEASLSIAVTVLLPPFSEIESELRLSVTVGVVSSSVMVKAVPVTATPASAPLTLTDSPLPSYTASCVGSMLKVAVPLPVPGAIVSVTSSTVA